MKNNSSLWITWENQRRNREISKRLKIPLFELKDIGEISNPLLKYTKGIWKTLTLIKRFKPSVIFGQNPSIILCLFLVAYKRVKNYKLIVDAHNAGIFPMEGRSRFLNWVSAIIQRKADLIIVTNNALARHVRNNGGRHYVLPDPIPEFRRPIKKILKNKKNLLFICTYAADEPYHDVFKAVHKLRDDVCIYVTGNFRKYKIDPKNMPGNLQFTGYMPEDEYIQMLYSVNGTIDLTSRENCLVCGAYESVAAGKPMILSNTTALKTHFFQGAVYTSNTSNDIAKSIEKMLENEASLIKEIIELREILQNQWMIAAKNLKSKVFEFNDNDDGYYTEVNGKPA